MSLLAALALLLPTSAFHNVWRLNPQAHAGLTAWGPWAVALMLTVGAACCSAAVGLWRGARWGRAVAVTILAVNMLSDAGNAFVRGELRTLIGVPIASALIAYILLNRRVRDYFDRTR